MKIFVLLYVIAIILIAEKDRRQIKIDRNLLLCGIIGSIVYMIYMYIIEPSSIYWSAIYLEIHAILLAIDTFVLKRYARDSYIIKILMLLNIIFTFTKLEITIYTIIMSILAILIYLLILQLRKKKNGNKKIKFDQIPVGFFVGASNLIILVMMFCITNYWIK